MKLKPIINSLLETDMYKFSMGQGINAMFPGYMTTWTFKCRNKDVFFTPEMVQEIGEQLEAYCKLEFAQEELDYLNKIPWIRGSYVYRLDGWKPKFKDFEISTNAPCGLSIEAKGTWFNTSMYEIPVLAIVNEVYFRMAYDYQDLKISFEERLDDKFNKVKDNQFYLASFSEFGLRRRLSAELEEEAVAKFATLNDTKHSASKFVGTSNVYLAKKLGINPVGTMAHEWIMCAGQGNLRHNPAFSNHYALTAWEEFYKTDNGIALTDTVTTDCFLRDFDKDLATVFSGVRHDSGDPYAWGEKMLQMYQGYGIDPKTKTLLFSDSLNFEKADKLAYYFKDKARVAFGIGTYIANDTYVEPLNIVMKTTACNGHDVAKIADTEGKGMCKNPEYVDLVKKNIEWRLKNEKVGARYD